MNNRRRMSLVSGLASAALLSFALHAQAASPAEALDFLRANVDLRDFGDGASPGNLPPASCTLELDARAPSVLRHSCTYSYVYYGRVIFQADKTVSLDLRDVNLMLSGPNLHDPSVVILDASPFDRVMSAVSIYVCDHERNCGTQGTHMRQMTFRTAGAHEAGGVADARRYLIGATTGR